MVSSGAYRWIRARQRSGHHDGRRIPWLAQPKSAASNLTEGILLRTVAGFPYSLRCVDQHRTQYKVNWIGSRTIRRPITTSTVAGAQMALKKIKQGISNTIASSGITFCG